MKRSCAIAAGATLAAFSAYVLWPSDWLLFVGSTSGALAWAQMALHAVGPEKR